MTYAQFASIVRLYTGTDSVSFPDADITLLANAFKDAFAEEISKRNEDYFGMPFTRNLEADRREYGIPDETIQIKYVEAMLDGSEWSHLDEFDLNSYRRPTSEADIREQFSMLPPKFDLFRRSLWIYSGDAIVNVTNGLKFWAIIYPANISDLSLSTDMSADPTETSYGLPRPFHELLARRVSIAWKDSRPRKVALSAKELLFESDFKKALDTITNANLDRVHTATVPYNDGQEY
jgi:hypothetical protein